MLSRSHNQCLKGEKPAGPGPVDAGGPAALPLTVATIIIALLIFGLLIVVHELGHFLVAKAAGIRVEEFSLGMGPALVKHRRGETLYSLRLLPIGGYNRMAGMEPGDDFNDPKGFNRQSLGWRLGVISAGSLMNFALPVFLYFLVFLTAGVPVNEPVVGRVTPGWPADQAGLRPGDRIVQIQEEKVTTWNRVVEIIHQRPGDPLRVVAERDGEQLTFTMTPREDPRSSLGMVGIEQSLIRYSPGQSLVMGFKQTGQFLVLLVVGLWQMLTGQVPADLVGPVGIVQLVGQAARFGLASVLSFAAFISLNLGVINLLPIPALDGSRLVFLAVEGIRHRPLDPEKENLVHLIGFMLLILFMIAVTYRDVTNIFGG
ncbi:MAG: RIP metalloprotease RseP [Clostridia bacterium]|nr:MAG: RIP metalloprotease RseP [Clostridia bacterium]